MPPVVSSVLDPNRPLLPEWTRWAWSSMIEREYWKPQFERLTNLRPHIEWITLLEGIRPAIFQHVAPDQLLLRTAEAAKHGILAIPIGQINTYDNYLSAKGEFDATKPWEYRVIFTRAEHAGKAAALATAEGNHDALGELLGYPKCCREFYARTWGCTSVSQVDTTWDQYATTGDANGPVEANILWRWMNVRWVSHLPCSFQCEATVEIGRKTREAIKKHGFVEEAKIMDMILSWPTRWSGVNGIAEIVGPCLKVSTRTDWAPPTDKRRFERAGRYSAPTREIWKDNGFTTYEAMLQLHAPIIEELKRLIPENGAALDLGCGNGRLLRAVKLHRSDIKIGGVDINADAITSVQASLVGKWDASSIQDLAWTSWFTPEDTVLVHCPVRLTEMTAEEATKTRAAMAAYKKHLVYVYGDNLLKQSLEGWISEAGYSVDKLLVICDQSATGVSLGILRMD